MSLNKYRLIPLTNLTNTTTSTITNLNFTVTNDYYPSASTMCANCGTRPGTEVWVGGGGVLAMSHGMYEMWCNICITEAQIAYAENIAATLPDLRAKLAALIGPDIE
jgi:hypothetical protein